MAKYGRKKSRKLTAGKVYKRKPSARNQQSQIATLARKTNKIAKTLAASKDWQLWKYESGNIAITSPRTPMKRLIDPGTWSQVFISTPAMAIDDLHHNFRVVSLTLDLVLLPYTEEDLVTYTFFVFKIKKDVADKIVNGQNDLASFIDNQDFVMNNGTAMLNRNKYETVYSRRFMTEQYTDASNNVKHPSGQLGPKRFYKKFKCGFNFKNTMGKWNEELGLGKVPPHERLYMTIFNNNASSVEGSPTYKYATLVAGYPF